MCTLVALPSFQSVLTYLSVWFSLTEKYFSKMIIHKRIACSIDYQSVIDAQMVSLEVLAYSEFSIILFHSPRVFQKIA